MPPVSIRPLPHREGFRETKEKLESLARPGHRSGTRQALRHPVRVSLAGSRSSFSMTGTLSKTRQVLLRSKDLLFKKISQLQRQQKLLDKTARFKKTVKKPSKKENSDQSIRRGLQYFASGTSGPMMLGMAWLGWWSFISKKFRRNPEANKAGQGPGWSEAFPGKKEDPLKKQKPLPMRKRVSRGFRSFIDWMLQPYTDFSDIFKLGEVKTPVRVLAFVLFGLPLMLMEKIVAIRDFFKRIRFSKPPKAIESSLQKKSSPPRDPIFESDGDHFFKLYNVPIRKLSPAEIAQFKAGAQQAGLPLEVFVAKELKNASPYMVEPWLRELFGDDLSAMKNWIRRGRVKGGGRFLARFLELGGLKRTQIFWIFDALGEIGSFAGLGFYIKAKEHLPNSYRKMGIYQSHIKFAELQLHLKGSTYRGSAYSFLETHYKNNEGDLRILRAFHALKRYEPLLQFLRMYSARPPASAKELEIADILVSAGFGEELGTAIDIWVWELNHSKPGDPKWITQAKIVAKEGTYIREALAYLKGVEANPHLNSLQKLALANAFWELGRLYLIRDLKNKSLNLAESLLMDPKVSFEADRLQDEIRSNPDEVATLKELKPLLMNSRTSNPYGLLQLEIMANDAKETDKKTWEEFKIKNNLRIISLPTKISEETKIDVGDSFLYLPGNHKLRLPRNHDGTLLITTHDLSKKFHFDNPPEILMIKRVNERFVSLHGDGKDQKDTEHSFRSIILENGQILKIGNYELKFIHHPDFMGLLELY